MLKYSIAAVVLVAGSSLALAEPNNGGPAAGGAMEHSSGAMKGGATEGNGGPSAGMRSGDMKAGKAERSSAAEDRSGKMDAEDRSGKMEKNAASSEERNAKERQASDKDRDLKSGERSDRLNKSADRSDRNGSDQAKDRSRNDKASTGASEGTAGNEQAKTGELSGISAEQKTKVISAFGSHRVAPARDIGVAVNVGVVVPRSVHFYPIPEDIVTIVPDYRGYEYFMIDDSHVAIVDPETLEVVDIIVIA